MIHEISVFRFLFFPLSIFQDGFSALVLSHWRIPKVLPDGDERLKFVGRVVGETLIRVR